MQYKITNGTVMVAIMAYTCFAYLNVSLKFACFTCVCLSFIALCAGYFDERFKRMIVKSKLAISTTVIIFFARYVVNNNSLGFALISIIGFMTLLDAADLWYNTKRARPFWWFAMVIVCFRTFCYDVMYVPSGSMTPTLLHGDFVLVKKAEYGFNKESLWPFGKLLPWLPAYQYKKPTNDEIVVWTRAYDPWLQYYVKRAVAVGGDTLQMKDGVLCVNNRPVELKIDKVIVYDHDYLFEDQAVAYSETSPISGVTKTIIRNSVLGEGYKDNTKPLILPEDHFTIVGDNRTDGGSHDGRDSAVFPPMPYTQIIGKAKMVLFSSNSWMKYPSEVSWGNWILTMPLRIVGMLYYMRWERFCKSI